MFLSARKVLMALMSPMVPMEIRSSMLMPVFSNRRAIYTTSRRFRSMSVCRACGSPCSRRAIHSARRFENTGINIEDLISIGTIGLIKAINTFRADKNIKLATYASRCIENEILMYLRKNSAQRTEVSFDEPLNTDWDGKELLLSDVLGTDGDVVMGPIEADVDRKLLAEAVSRLSPREKDIISLRFGLGGRKELTQKEVADRMGISQSYISRLEKRIISRLRREMQKLS